MNRVVAGRAAAAARRTQDCGWAELAELLGRSVVWTTSAVLGQQPLTAEQAQAVGSRLGLDAETTAALAGPAYRGADAVDASEPLAYRLGEIVQVYGAALTELITEEFGDGIMSAIDFELSMERKADPKGDRVVITLDGKFLPYRVW